MVNYLGNVPVFSNVLLAVEIIINKLYIFQFTLFEFVSMESFALPLREIIFKIILFFTFDVQTCSIGVVLLAARPWQGNGHKD